MEHRPVTVASDAPVRFRGWRGTLTPGETRYGWRLKLAGEYLVDPGGSGKRLERRVAEDIDPSLFTVHIADAPGQGGTWIPLTREFAASRDVEHVVLKDERGSYRFPVEPA